MPTLKIFFSCSGVGIFNRGIESFFREAFDGLRGTEGLEIALCKGAGEEKSDEHVLWNLPRTGAAARALGTLIQRDAYVTEQLSSLPSMVRAIRKHRPDIIFYSDSNLGFQLFRWRRQIGVPFRLLFSNGGPCHPPFVRTDYVQQVAPLYYEEAIAAGEPPERHRMVPYGIQVPEGASDRSRNTVERLRRELGLPLDRPIVLSVGSISATHKRMDYVVREVERVKAKVEWSLRGQSDIDEAQRVSERERPNQNGEDNPFLVLLGAVAPDTDEIAALAREKLGEGNFAIRSVPYEQVADYYGAADLFVLASLKEGFGRVFLEALIHGLPVIVHDHPVMRFVLGVEGTFGDFSEEGALAGLISAQLRQPEAAGNASRRRESVRQRFSWPVLAPQYRDMFFDCVEKVRPF